MILRRLSMTCLLLLLAGCAAGGAKPAVSAAPQAFRAVDQEIAYHVFMGELAVGRGDAKDAVQEYQAAARISMDPSLAAHAAVLAYGDGDLIDALALARRWQTLAPDSADAT